MCILLKNALYFDVFVKKLFLKSFLYQRVVGYMWHKTLYQLKTVSRFFGKSKKIKKKIKVQNMTYIKFILPIFLMYRVMQKMSEARLGSVDWNIRVLSIAAPVKHSRAIIKFYSFSTFFYSGRMYYVGLIVGDRNLWFQKVGKRVAAQLKPPDPTLFYRTTKI